MASSNLRTIERKVLGALLVLADNEMNVIAKHNDIVGVMGYKKTGGIVTYALQSLEMKNYIQINDKGNYTVLI